MPPSVPREKIPWFPTIDVDACIGDQECVKFCKNDVFVWDELQHPARGGSPFQLCGWL